MKIYKTYHIVRPIMTYEAETTSDTKATQTKVRTTEKMSGEDMVCKMS